MRRLSIALAAMAVAASMLLALSGCDSFQGGDYAPELKIPEVEPPAISQEGTLKVGVDTSNSPLAGVSGEKIIGIDVDVAGALGDALGLKVELEDVGSDGVDAITNGDVDIVLGVNSDSSEKDMWLSSEYIPTGIVVFALESSDKQAPKPGDSSKIAAQVSSKSAWAITNSFGEKSLTSETDLATAFQALEARDVDYVASDAIIGLYAANRQGVKVKMVGVIGATSGYCVMANKSNRELISPLSEAVTQIVDDGIMNVIELKWLNSTVNLSDLPKIEAKKGNVDANVGNAGVSNNADGAKADDGATNGADNSAD